MGSRRHDTCWVDPDNTMRPGKTAASRAAYGTWISICTLNTSALTQANHQWLRRRRPLPVDRGIEVPLPPGYEFEPTVEVEEIQANFFASHPNANAIWERLLDVLPENVSGAILEPRHVIAFDESYFVDGKEVRTRMALWSYSIRDAAEEPLDLLPPDPNETGDPRQD